MNLSSIVSEVVTVLEDAGHAVAGSINAPAAEQIALRAFLSGGPTAVVPALIEDAAQWVDPAHVAAVVFALNVAEKVLHQSTVLSHQ